MIYTCLRLPSRGWYSFTDPGGMKGWVYLGAKYSQLRFEPATSWLQIWHSTTQPLGHWFLLPFRNIMARAVLSIYLQLELCVRNIIEVDECSGTCGEVGIATRRRHCIWIYFVSNIIQVSGAEADWCWDARFTRHSRWFGWQRKHLRDSQLIQFRFYPRYYLSFWFYCSPSTSALIVPSTRLSTVSDRAFPPGREPVCGTLCWLKSPPRRRSRRSRNGKRRYCLHGVTLTVPDVSDIFVCCPLHCSHVLVLSVFLFCCCKVSQHSSHWHCAVLISSFYE